MIAQVLERLIIQKNDQNHANFVFSKETSVDLLYNQEKELGQLFAQV